MKKKMFVSRLSLDKKIIGALTAQSVMGGVTQTIGCPQTAACPQTTVCPVETTRCNTAAPDLCQPSYLIGGCDTRRNCPSQFCTLSTPEDPC